MNPQTICHLPIKDSGIYIIKLFKEHTKDCKTGHFKILGLSKMEGYIKKNISGPAPIAIFRL